MGHRRRRQDVAANEVTQMVSTVGFESSLWSSDSWAGKLLKSQINEIYTARSRLLKT